MVNDESYSSFPERKGIIFQKKIYITKDKSKSTEFTCSWFVTFCFLQSSILAWL